MRQVIVVCDHGISSRFYAEHLRREFDKLGEAADVMACGVFAKVPTEYDLKEAVAVITAYEEGQLEALKKKGLKDEYIAVWKAFFKRVKEAGKPVYTYYDYETHVFNEPKAMAKKIMGSTD